MSGQHQQWKDRLVAAVVEGKGDSSPALRRAIMAAMADPQVRLELGQKPDAAPLQQYLQKVNRHAYRIIDEEVVALKAQNLSEDAIFELTVSAAVGAGLFRLEKALSLLHPARSATKEVNHAFA